MREGSDGGLHGMGERAREVVATEFQWERSAGILADGYARNARG
jgi:hypothetical protein